MSVVTSFHQRWQVRPTLRLTGTWDQARLDRVADALRQHPDIAFVAVGVEHGEQSDGITATIVLAQPSAPGVAVDEATRLLADACIAAGLTTDRVKEIVAEAADVDPRSL